MSVFFVLCVTRLCYLPYVLPSISTQIHAHKQQMDNNFSFIKLAMTKTNCHGIDFFAASRAGVPANAGVIYGVCLGVLQFIHWAGAVIHHNANIGRTIIKSARVNQKS